MCNFIGIAFITKMCKENAQRAIFTAMQLRQYKKYNNYNNYLLQCNSVNQKI